MIASLNRGFKKKLLFNRASISHSGAMVRHKTFQTVIGPLNLEAAFYFILFFSFRFNRAIISPSGAVVHLKNFQSVIGPLNKGSTP